MMDPFLILILFFSKINFHGLLDFVVQMATTPPPFFSLYQLYSMYCTSLFAPVTFIPFDE